MDLYFALQQGQGSFFLCWFHSSEEGGPLDGIWWPATLHVAKTQRALCCSKWVFKRSDKTGKRWFGMKHWGLILSHQAEFLTEKGRLAAPKVRNSSGQLTSCLSTNPDLTVTSVDPDQSRPPAFAKHTIWCPFCIHNGWTDKPATSLT